MQQIKTGVPKSKTVDAISIPNAEIFILQIEEVTGTIEDGELGVYQFSDGVIPPCTTIGYRTYDVASSSWSENKAIQSISDIAKLFDLPSEDADTMEKYALDMARQLHLQIIPVENGIIFVSDILNEMAENCVKQSDITITWTDVQRRAAENTTIYTATTSMGIATIIGKLVESGIGRFNKIHYQDTANRIAELVNSSKRIHDESNNTNLTIADIEALFNTVKSLIHI